APFAPPPANGQQTARGSSPAAVAHHETRAGQRRRPPAPLASVLQSVVPSIAPFRGLIPRKDCHQNALQRARPRETVELNGCAKNQSPRTCDLIVYLATSVKRSSRLTLSSMIGPRD